MGANDHQSMANLDLKGIVAGRSSDFEVVRPLTVVYLVVTALARGV